MRGQEMGGKMGGKSRSASLVTKTDTRQKAVWEGIVIDRKSVVKGESVDLGGRRISKKRRHRNGWVNVRHVPRWKTGWVSGLAVRRSTGSAEPHRPHTFARRYVSWPRTER